MKRIVLLFSLMVASLSFAQGGTDFNPRKEVIYQNQVWTWNTDDELRESGDSWIEDMLNLKLHTSPSTLESARWSPELSENLDNDRIYLEVPYLSCGIGYDVYMLVAETENSLFFERVNMSTGQTIGNAIVFSKRSS